MTSTGEPAAPAGVDARDILALVLACEACAGWKYQLHIVDVVPSSDIPKSDVIEAAPKACKGR